MPIVNVAAKLVLLTSLSGSAAAVKGTSGFPLDFLPAAPVAGDAIVLRLRNSDPLPMQFVVMPGYPMITRADNHFSILALICRFPYASPGPLTRDLALGPLGAATYSIDVEVIDICNSTGTPPRAVWSTTFVVRGQQTAIPTLGFFGLGALGFGLALTAAVASLRHTRR